MALFTPFNPGTITVVNGSADAVGIGTDFLHYRVGDTIWKDGIQIRILTITDLEHLTFAFDWPGSSDTGIYDWIPQVDSQKFKESIEELILRLQSGAFFQFMAQGTLAERDDYDEELKDFTYLQTDVVPFQLWIKASDADGDWAGPSSYAGIEGPQGGDRYDVAFHDPGRPGAGEEVFKHICVAEQVDFPLNLEDSMCEAAIAADFVADWSLQKNGVEFAVMTFAAASTVATFVGTATTFVAGDILTIVAPNPRDDTLEDIFGTLAGSRPHVE